ncbi:MAG: hypothetical protein WC807_09285 [Hyphomicrobium sp.]|jgi:hypothetical protein
MFLLPVRSLLAVVCLTIVGALCAHAEPPSRTIEDLLEGNGIYGSPSTAGAATQTPNAETPSAVNSGAVPVPADGGSALPSETPAAPASILPGDKAVPAPLQPISIEWRLTNPFRFFVDPADTEMHRATFASLTPEQRHVSPVLSAERALSRRHDDGWAGMVVGKTCWDASRNRHVCSDKEDYVNPESHEVQVTLNGVADAGIDCTWLTAPKGGPRARGSAITKPCSEIVTIDVPYPAGMGVSVEIGGRKVASADLRVRDILVVGMGDSFGSGEGNPDLPVRFSPERAITYGKAGKEGDSSGYPARVGPWKQVGDKAFIDENARWLDQACHRSLYSFELRTALQLAIEDPHRSVTYVGLACSGAEVTFGLFLRYKGNEWVPRPPDLSQVSAAADAQCGKRDAPLQDLPEAYHMQGTIPELQGGLTLKKCPIELARKIDLLLLSIGGNDVGFARLVANAVLGDESLVRKLGGWFGQVHGNREAEDLLERLDDRYKAMNRALHGILHMPWNQSDRVILTSYPPFALVDDAGAVCRDGNAGMDVFNEFAITEKSALSSAWLADKLDQIMEQSAKRHDWSFVNAHRKVFVGHGLCAGHVDGTGSLADDLRMPRRHEDRWVPYNPALFQAYAERTRWFRTPNDAFLTGNFHVSGSVLQKVLKLQSLSWFQILLASTYSGAFHPSAEGQAAIADAVVLRARAVLAKYGQQSSVTAAAKE